MLDFGQKNLILFLVNFPLNKLIGKKGFNTFITSTNNSRDAIDKNRRNNQLNHSSSDSDFDNSHINQTRKHNTNTTFANPIKNPKNHRITANSILFKYFFKRFLKLSKEAY